MLKIYPYKTASASARVLRDSMNGLILKTENSRYRYRPNHFIINWGNSKRAPHLVGVPMLNSPEDVAVASNKLLAFQQLQASNVPTVEFTTETQVAQDWLSNQRTVFVRNKLTGHSGEGIEVVKPLVHEEHEDIDMLHDVMDRLGERGYDLIADEIEQEILGIVDAQQPEQVLPPAPLYTKGVVNSGEYRVHVFKEEVILYQKKSRRLNDEGEVDTAEGEAADVRNLESNWIYRTGNLKTLERVENLAIDAVNALDLDFGAVDIIMDNEGQVFVLEINSAPGLGNTQTREAYVNAINKLIN